MYQIELTINDKDHNGFIIAIIANVTGILYTLKRILLAIIENLRTEISFSASHQGVNDIFTLKSITVSSFSDCQKHEGIITTPVEQGVLGVFQHSHFFDQDNRITIKKILFLFPKLVAYNQAIKCYGKVYLARRVEASCK